MLATYSSPSDDTETIPHPGFSGSGVSTSFNLDYT